VVPAAGSGPPHVGKLELGTPVHLEMQVVEIILEYPLVDLLTTL
jgi:hypothetical protein